MMAFTFLHETHSKSVNNKNNQQIAEIVRNMKKKNMVN